MAVDASGNVYVAGQSKDWYITIKYDTNSKQLWTGECHGSLCGDGEARAAALGEAGSVYITGKNYSPRTMDFGYATIKYDSEGRQRWLARFDGNPRYDGQSEAVAIAVDNKSGNVYVTGNIWGSSDWDYVTAAYNNGKELWAARYDGPAGRQDQAVAIAVDGQGNVYVTGKSDGGSSCADYLTIKYVPKGPSP